MKSEIKILFLGAGKRYTLLQHFKSLNNINLFSIEDAKEVPIKPLVEKIFIGPKFDSPTFTPFLLNVCNTNKIDLVIPNMDSATVALSEVKSLVNGVVSDNHICKKFNNKTSADAFFKHHNIRTPKVFYNEYDVKFPCIKKLVDGYGSRKQKIIWSEQDADFDFSNRDFMYQKFIENAVEYTVDAYVDKKGNLVDALSRVRLQVVNGEVFTSQVHEHKTVLEYVEKILKCEPGWYGPITLQFLVDSSNTVYALEINPRFGGGVTHSIHCGLNMPEWILFEHLGLKIKYESSWKHTTSLMTRYYGDIFHDNCC